MSLAARPSVSSPLGQAALTAGVLVGFLALYELVKSKLVVPTSRASRASAARRRRASTTDDELGALPDEEEDEEDSSSADDEDVITSDGVSFKGLKFGKDGRPTAGLQREKLIVRDGRMPDAEINTYLSVLLEHLKERTRHHLGYPYNLSFRSDNLVPFLQYSINNLGDPFVASNYGVHSRDFEIAVLDFFADLYGIKKDEYWGYCTCSGTEGNLLGVLYGREKFKPARNAVLYCSKDTHYSIPKAAAMYQMDIEICDTDATGEMVYSDLERRIKLHLDRPLVINVNVGTTVKGASDTLDEVLAILKRLNIPRERFYIHVDGALSGVILPFVSSKCENKRVTFEKPIDSVSVSGHKMLGTPMPSGIVITRSEHSKNFGKGVEYLNSTDTTIMGSRNGQSAIAMWVALQRKGIDGLRHDVVQCIDNAKYLKELLDQSGVPAWLNEFSTTVTFERPPEAVVQKWQLACKNTISHVVVMPSVSKSKLRSFHRDVVEARRGPAHVPHVAPRPAEMALKQQDTTAFTGGG